MKRKGRHSKPRRGAVIPESTSWGRTGAMAAGLIMAILALFMAPMSVREICTHINRGDFVRDEVQLEFFNPGSGRHSSPRLDVRIVSMGEPYRIHRMNVVSLDRLRELSREHRLEGYRAPVWYLPTGGFWSAIDKINEFRVQSPDEFDQGLPAGLIAVNVVFAWGCVFLIRRGAGFPKVARR